MRKTYRITIRVIHDWWLEIGARGHKLFILAFFLVILGACTIMISTYLAVTTKLYYRQQIEENNRRLDQLEKNKGY